MKFFDNILENLETLVHILSKLTYKRREKRSKATFFGNYSVEVDILQPRWEKSVTALLKTTQVRTYKMDGAGIMEISGPVDPEALLKTIAKQGKKVKLRSFEFGLCSSLLHPKNGGVVPGSKPGLSVPAAP